MDFWGSGDSVTHLALERCSWLSLSHLNSVFATGPALPLRWDVAVVWYFVTAEW